MVFFLSSVLFIRSRLYNCGWGYEKIELCIVSQSLYGIYIDEDVRRLDTLDTTPLSRSLRNNNT